VKVLEPRSCEADSGGSTFSPVDVQTLRAGQMKLSSGGMIFDRTVERRQKTGRAAVGTLIKRTQRLVEAYLVCRGVWRFSA
jgi:hypothetical protein